MFKHILIPLDGSLLAEAVLPAGAYLAGVCGSAVTLLHVIERDAPRRSMVSAICTMPERPENTWTRLHAARFPPACAWSGMSTPTV